MFYYGAPQIPGLYPSMDAVLHRLQSLSPAAHLLNLTLEKAPAKTLPTDSNAADPNQLADYPEARGLVSMPVPVPALPAFANDGLWLRAYCRPGQQFERFQQLAHGLVPGLRREIMVVS